MTNRYPGWCSKCRKEVPVGKGTCEKASSGRWLTFCAACRAAAAPAPASSGQPASAVGVIRCWLLAATLRVATTPATRLVGDLWERYQSTCRGAGAGFSKAETAQVCSLQQGPALLQALQAAGFVLQVSDDLKAKLEAQVAQAGADVNAAQGRAQVVDEALRARGLALYPYQKLGIEWLAPRTTALLSDDLGCGKSCQALVAAPSGAPILVIAPAVAKGVWVREAAKWRPDLKPVFLSGRGSFRWPVSGEMLTTNFDILPSVEVKGADGKATPAPFLADCPEGLVVVVDEAHNVKSAKAQRTTKVRALCEVARKRGGRSWLLTGTPLLNRPPELWSVLRCAGLEKDVFGSWLKFMDAFHAAKGRFGIEWGAPRSDVPERLKRGMLRRMKRDVLTDLPAKRSQELKVNGLDAKTRKLCDEAIEAITARGLTLEQAVKHAAGTAGGGVGFEEMSRALAALAVAKIPSVLALVEDYEEQEEPVVVFSAHRAPVDALATREGWAAITGETSAEERTRIEDAFQRGEYKGIAATIQAGGVAITLTRASNAIFVDRLFTPSLNLQAEDRIYRIGQKSAVLITVLVAEHALDERIASILADKTALIDASVDAATRGATERVTDETAAMTAQVLAQLEAQADLARRALEGEAAASAELAALMAEVELLEQERLQQTRERQAQDLVEEKKRRFDAAIGRAATREREKFDSVPRGPVSEREVWAAQALVQLAACDGDYAFIRNGAGFSKSDTYLGHALAQLASTVGLDDRAWGLAVATCARYWRQVGKMPERETLAAPAPAEAPAEPQEAPHDDCGPAPARYACCAKARRVGGCICACQTWCPDHGTACHGSHE